MDTVALVLSLTAIVVSVLAFAVQSTRKAPISFLIIGGDGGGIEGMGEVIFKRVGQVDDKGMLRFATDGDSQTWPSKELLAYKGCLVWVLVALRELQERKEARWT